MNIRFDKQHIRFEDAAIDYDPYYFAIAVEDAGATYSDALKQTLSQWAEALATTDADGRTFYLPFGLYDQSIECFAATVIGELVTLRRVWISEYGYALDLDYLHPFIAHNHEDIKAQPENFGMFGRSEFIQALLNAEQIA